MRIANTYEGRPCPRFGHTLRYVSNGHCVVCARASIATWEKQYPEKKRASFTQWHAKNKEAVSAQGKRWYAENTERAGASGARWQKWNPDKVNAKSARWAKKYPEKNRAKRARHRARKISAEGSYTGADVMRLYEAQGGLCLCGTNLRDGYHIDHVMPLSRGGSNWPDNLQLLCAPCNSSKGARTMDEWSPALRRAA